MEIKLFHWRKKKRLNQNRKKFGEKKSHVNKRNPIPVGNPKRSNNIPQEILPHSQQAPKAGQQKVLSVLTSALVQERPWALSEQAEGRAAPHHGHSVAQNRQWQSPGGLPKSPTDTPQQTHLYRLLTRKFPFSTSTCIYRAAKQVLSPVNGFRARGGSWGRDQEKEFISKSSLWLLGLSPELLSCSQCQL